MDDFTKSELETLMKIIDKVEPFSYIEGSASLSMKIQSMIDNYCEHAQTYPDYDVVPERCRKCMALLDE